MTVPQAVAASSLSGQHNLNFDISGLLFQQSCQRLAIDWEVEPPGHVTAEMQQ